MHFESSKLSNGINILTFNIAHVSSVSINITVNVGSRYESNKESGISHFLEHMMFKGTKNRTNQHIAKEFDKIGGYFNAYTSREHTVFYCKVLSKNFTKVIRILGDIFQNSLFSEEDIEKELSVIKQEISGINDNPDELVYEKLYSLAFKNQPIGRSILGDIKMLSHFEKQDFLNFLDKHYFAENIYISVAGNISHDVVRKVTENYFSLIKPSLTYPEMILADYKGGFIYTNKDLDQTSVALGFKGVSSTNITEFYYIEILSIILGGSLSSRLFQKIREELGLAYSIFTLNNSYYDSGIFTIYAATNPRNIKKLLNNLLIEISEVQEKILQEELQRAKSQIKSSILMAEERPEYKSEEIGKNFILFKKYFSTNEIINIVMNTNINDITRCAKKVFASEPTLSIVGKIHKSFNFSLLK